MWSACGAKVPHPTTYPWRGCSRTEFTDSPISDKEPVDALCLTPSHAYRPPQTQPSVAPSKASFAIAKTPTRGGEKVGYWISRPDSGSHPPNATNHIQVTFRFLPSSPLDGLRSTALLCTDYSLHTCTYAPEDPCPAEQPTSLAPKFLMKFLIRSLLAYSGIAFPEKHRSDLLRTPYSVCRASIRISIRLLIHQVDKAFTLSI